ncbi:MAG: hypothetical protein HRT52_10855 [Colwellia sp.]|nr:hypothetical protein [Colwellia sp.]
MLLLFSCFSLTVVFFKLFELSMMFFLAVFIGVVCAAFFYCQAFKSGLARKRWAFAGLIMGPAVWPMFCMQKRMKINKLFGFNYLIFRA